MKLLTISATVLTTTAVAAPPHDVKPRALANDNAPHQDDPNFISAVMDAHWYWRRVHCAKDLVWDAGLANAARNDIATCSKKPYHMRGGSNLSSVSPVPSSYDQWIAFARDATHGWHDEETKYPYMDPHFDEAWGHFTQMVWRNTTRIGCALGDCGSGVTWPGRFYCYYDFAGNNIATGQFKAQVWGPICRDRLNN
ncbi:hypothetical protein E8E13_011547 [Curvularia kusanoi]|uniref:SCP domain-containing protein n=1 Tax=Curvularia kusanoi TaxID=90978 RepID=A0A9P4WEV5_CURKU|nr:hypothetical protein E8E13_011547 [Curvularia kusanoi]